MNKIISFMKNYLIFGLPFVVAFMIFDTISANSMGKIVIPEILRNILGFNVMFWFGSLILFLVILIAIPNAREKILRRLANLKERDEREEYITGKAARATYVSTLSLIIFFLFFSMFSLNLAIVPKEQARDGHRHTLSINFNFSLLNKHEPERNPKEKILFDSKDISLSSSAILLILLGWQLLAFNLASRKEQLSD